MRSAWLPPLLLLLHAAGLASGGDCMAHCNNPCAQLNGNLNVECGACGPDIYCNPDAEDFRADPNTRRKKTESMVRRAVGGDGDSEPYKSDDQGDGGDGYGEDSRSHDAEVARKVGPDTPDGPIELTGSSYLMADKYFNIAMRHRDADGLVKGKARNTTDYEPNPLPMPQDSPRTCVQHDCRLIEGDDACIEGRADCPGPRGHMQPLGKQWDVTLVEEWDARAHGPMDSPTFYRKYMRPHAPLIIRGGAEAATPTKYWTDEALLQNCTRKGGHGWYVSVETFNRITSVDRNDVMPDWTFCDFLERYQLPEYGSLLYSINAVAFPGSRLSDNIAVPEELACPELYNSIHDAMMWFSNGNTSSSLHFDTHENYFMQLSGTKDIYIWHPNETAHFYMDFQPKYGLSPINVDHVDLQAFPSLKNVQKTYLATIHEGDAVYIPDSWWHFIHSLPGRNLAVALDYAPYAGKASLWPGKIRRRKDNKGVFWAEGAIIEGNMDIKYAKYLPSRITRRPIACEAPSPPAGEPNGRPATISDIPNIGEEPNFNVDVPPPFRNGIPKAWMELAGKDEL